MPLIRQMPHKRGFRNPFRIEYTPINLATLSDRFPANASVDAEALVRARLLKRADEPFKILAAGDLGPRTHRARAKGVGRRPSEDRSRRWNP